ncbi:hypothetical protein Tco_1497932, partial [Tanacetum coccineum]
RVTYTAVSSPFGGLSDIGSLGVDGLPMMLEDPYLEAAVQAPASPDYVSGPEYPPLPEFVPEPIYPEFMPLEDKEDKEDPGEDLIDYLADRGDDDDDDDESSDDDEDDDDDVEEDEDEEEEEEHPALADSVPPPVHRIPSPPLPISSPVLVSPPPLPASPTYPLGFRAAMIRQRAESLSTSHSLPLPPPIILSYTRAFVTMMRAAAPSTYILASRSETPP